MRDYFNLKKHEDKLNYAKVGKVLLKDEYGKTGPDIIEKEYQILSVMENFERRFEYKSIVKAFETTMNKKKNNLILSGYNSKRNNNLSNEQNKLLLTKIKYKPQLKFRSSSAIKLLNNNINDTSIKSKINLNKKMGKTLSYDNFPAFKNKTYNHNIRFFPFFVNSQKNKDVKIKTKSKKIICFPSNNDNFNFTNSINLRMNILKKKEKENKMKKYLYLNELKDKIIKNDIYYNSEKINNKNDKGSFDSYISKNDLEESIEKDPFKEIKNKFEYGKIMEKLKEKYKFYPYSYLEEHKNIDKNKYKFMIDNFNTKFSLFGKNNILNNESKKYSKKINYHGNNKPSLKIIEKIISNKNKDIYL